MTEKIIENSAYRIVNELAKGGMGSVSEAFHLGADGFEKRVAIKQLLPTLSDSSEFVAMFIAEAKLVADLVHENIVQIYQFNRGQNGYYIVMEFVHGLSLAEFIEKHDGDQQLPVELAVFITSRIARGLAYAHSRHDSAGAPMNIVHCDVCPRNILVTTEGLPKLGDFGIAKAADQYLSPNPGERSLGKLAYMSPEQAWDHPVDHRSDVYSLGLVLFELLTMSKGREKWSSNMRFAAAKGWVDWDKLPRRVKSGLRKILKRMLDPEPDGRYASTDELAHDLEYFIYRKGYGPTVVTLEKYLRELCPSLYQVMPPSPSA